MPLCIHLERREPFRFELEGYTCVDEGEWPLSLGTPVLCARWGRSPCGVRGAVLCTKDLATLVRRLEYLYVRANRSLRVAGSMLAVYPLSVLLASTDKELDSLMVTKIVNRTDKNGHP